MTKKHLFKGGQYYIGDPCYVVRGDAWDALLDETGQFGLPKFKRTAFWDSGLFIYKDNFCFASHTKYGDGSYLLQSPVNRNITSVPVDAGLIACMPIESLDGTANLVLSFIKDFLVWEDRGVFHFGDYTISTNY